MRDHRKFLRAASQRRGKPDEPDKEGDDSGRQGEDLFRVHFLGLLVPRGIRFPVPLAALLQTDNDTQEDEGDNELDHSTLDVGKP
jgi:hypothetical protein